MISLTAHTPIFIALDPIDFRCGIDKLKIIAENLSGKNPLLGMLFIFRNRQKNAIKIIVYDGTGFWLHHKRLSSSRFKWWPKTGLESEIDAGELQIILAGADPRGVFPKKWHRIKNSKGPSFDSRDKSRFKPG